MALSPEDLADELDNMVDSRSKETFNGSSNEFLDTMEALLRFPQAEVAVKIIRPETRTYLSVYLERRKEFEKIYRLVSTID